MQKRRDDTLSPAFNDCQTLYLVTPEASKNGIVWNAEHCVIRSTCPTLMTIHGQERLQEMIHTGRTRIQQRVQ
eukprot:2364346-Amphidinium_carterae.1